MEMKELRIGNNVLESGYNGFKVSEICGTDFNRSEALFRPIPLTEEWLKRFGFKHEYLQDNNSPKTYYWCLEYETSEQINAIIFIDGKISGYNHVKNVHQLQNLYFALTGEELEIKK